MQRNREKQQNGKNRDLFMKMRNTKGIFHAMMGSIEERNVRTKQKQKILRRGDKNIHRDVQKKIFMTQIIRMV